MAPFLMQSERSLSWLRTESVSALSLKAKWTGVQLHLSAVPLAQTPAWQVSPVPQSSLVAQVLGTHWLFLHRAPGPQSPSAVQALGVHLPAWQLEPAGQFWSVVHSGL